MVLVKGDMVAKEVGCTMIDSEQGVGGMAGKVQKGDGGGDESCITRKLILCLFAMVLSCRYCISRLSTSIAWCIL